MKRNIENMEKNYLLKKKSNLQKSVRKTKYQTFENQLDYCISTDLKVLAEALNDNIPSGFSSTISIGKVVLIVDRNTLVVDFEITLSYYINGLEYIESLDSTFTLRPEDFMVNYCKLDESSKYIQLKNYSHDSKEDFKNIYDLTVRNEVLELISKIKTQIK